MTISISLRDCRWCRLLAKAVGILLLVLSAALLLSIAINRFDEPIDRAAQAWLDTPVPSAPQTSQNGYLALLALTAQAADPIAAGGEVVRAQHAIFADSRVSHQDTEPRYRELRTRLLKPAKASMSLVDCKSECFNYILKNAEKIRRLSAERANLLQRYDTMLDFPVYFQDTPRDPALPYPYRDSAESLGILYLGSMVFTVQQGDLQTAFRQWARHQRFWQSAAVGSTTLGDTMNAMGHLERNQALLADLLAAYPQSAAAARSHGLPVLAGRPQLALLPARRMVAEFQMQSYAVTALVPHFSLYAVGEAQPIGLADRLALLFYQPNATSNLLHRLHQYDLARNSVALDEKMQVIRTGAQIEAPCESNWRLLSNPVGKLLLCDEGSYDYHHHHERAAKVDATARRLERKLQPIR